MQRFFSFYIAIFLLILTVLSAWDQPISAIERNLTEPCRGAREAPLDGWIEISPAATEGPQFLTFRLPHAGLLSLEVISFGTSNRQLYLLDKTCRPLATSVSYHPSHIADVLPRGIYHVAIDSFGDSSGFRLQSGFLPSSGEQHVDGPVEEPRDEWEDLTGGEQHVDGPVEEPRDEWEDLTGGDSELLAALCPRTSSGDAGESLLCARPILLGGHLEGSFRNREVTDRDAYRFFAASPVTIVLWADSFVDMQGQILDTSGRRIVAGPMGAAEQELQAVLPAGTYTLLLESPGGAQGLYRLYSVIGPANH